MNTRFGSGQEDNEPGFAELLRSYIRRAGMTYEELAEVANVSFDTVRNWTRGVANPRKWQDVLRLAAALGLTSNQADLLLRAARHPRLTHLLRTHAKDESLADWRAALAAEAVDAHGPGQANNRPDERPFAPAAEAVDVSTQYSDAPSAIENEQDIAGSAGDASPPLQLEDEGLPPSTILGTQAATGENSSLAVRLAELPASAPSIPRRAVAAISVIAGLVVLLLLTVILVLHNNAATNDAGAKQAPTLVSNAANRAPTMKLLSPAATAVATGATATPTSGRIPASYILRGVYMVAPNQGWIVGASDPDNLHGVILAYNGGAWVEQQISDVHALNSIAMYSANEGWAVGAHGDIMRYSGGQWRKSDLIADAQLNSVSLTAAAEGWAVGNTGTILQLHAGKWTNYSQFVTDENLRTVYMISADEGWAVGGEDGGGVFIHYKNGKWSRDFAKVDGADIRGYPAALYMLSSAQGWAFCNGGYIMEYSAGKWGIAQRAPTDKLIRAATKVSATEGWATASDGLILHYVGGNWTSVNKLTEANLNGIYMFDQNEGWAVGEQGTILHYQNGTWQQWQQL
jgi:photosystem II stability/assembly factor-like uncharacterized protein/transcriptional regulator with XRE-family HTH domain